MKYAKFSDDFLSYFRLDDNGETLVLTDMRGYTRAVRLLPYEERPQGKWITVSYNRDELNCPEKSMLDFVKCPFCETIHQGRHNFCSRCGADMQEGGAE